MSVFVGPLDAASLQGAAISSTPASAGQALIWSGSAWAPTASPGWKGLSATNPVGGVDGDLYFNTALHILMYYDGVRAKWLSVEMMSFVWGSLANIAPNAYFFSQGVVMTPSSGLYLTRNATIVGFDYSRTDSDAATFEIMNGITSLTTVPSAVFGDSTWALNVDVATGGIVGVKNQLGGNTVSNARGAVYLRWRV